MALDISMRLAHVNDVSIARVVTGFGTESGAMKDGRIKVDGKIYEVKFLEGGTTEVRRNYQGIFAWFRNKYCHKNTATALALQSKIDNVLSQADTKEYKIISGTHRKLLGLLEKSTARNIEVGNYGFAPNRDIITDSNLVVLMNEKLRSQGRSIKFNKIDSYNALIGISAATIDPREFPEMMAKIANNKLKTRIPEYFEDNFEKQDLAEWKAFLAKPQNAAKIDIVSKLNRYMNLPEGFKPSKETGWEAAFARDKNAALRSFVLKNLSYGARDLPSDAIDLLAERLKRYVEICSLGDAKERDAKLGEFFAKTNWLTPKEQKQYEEFAAKNGEKMAKSVIEKKTLDERTLFNTFRNILSVAFFRQTSKLGLDFFRDKGTPVMFQFSDYSGKSYIGREKQLFEPEAWRQGENSPEFRENGGAAITNSEMRHAVRMGENTSALFVGGIVP
ncbi:MAG: hypothetical protein ILO34_02620 [Kiritimatiellae bacterium]|nr:hypothetical protein [Kiritimatiellia bacterium]